MITNTNNGKGLNHSPSITPAQDTRPQEPTPNRETGTRQESTTRRESTSKFEQSVILQQSPVWSRAILWVLMGVTTGTIVWACVAKIEEAIPATGKLEPIAAVKEIQAPVGGVVKAVYVADGERVEQGDRLLSLEPTATVAQLGSLQKVRTALTQENEFYRAQMRGLPFSPAVEQAMAQLKLPEELLSLTKSRAALAAENQTYRTLISGSTKGSRLTPDQIERLESIQAELSTRVAAVSSEVEQLGRQLKQNEIQLASAKDNLAMNQEILNNIEPLAKEGAMSRIQYIQQRQEVRTGLAEVDQLAQEQERLKLEIYAKKASVQNTLALTRKDLLTEIAGNDKAIAEIDSQLSKAMMENNKRIAEIDSELSQAQLTLKYQDLRAPVSGTVFDLQADATGFVANASEPVLKIVPDDALTAKVYITNKDIGFVKEGMAVDVRMDSFPFSEFGDVKGKLVWIGDDALPPDEIRPYYSFPAKVRLERQAILLNGREVSLQSGMSVSANIKLRHRTVMSIFTDLFTRKIESVRFVR